MGLDIGFGESISVLSMWWFTGETYDLINVIKKEQELKAATEESEPDDK